MVKPDKFSLKLCNSHLWGLTRTKDNAIETVSKLMAKCTYQLIGFNKHSVFQKMWFISAETFFDV